MKFNNVITNLTFIFILTFFLNSCKGGGLPGADARKVSADPRDRVQKNIEEGRGFRLMGSVKNKTGEFDFASSNELWRASLDTLEFMPLALANYSGGIIVTDWYSDNDSSNESVKISVRFLSNEVRSDALAIKVFYKSCSVQQTCKITDRSGALSSELTEKILTKAAIYEKETKSKKKTKYINEALKD
tara:strand:+ start:1432 stop:1995 length:564 start_codon:yes stop_codon:yes gene_type:complete